MKRLSILYADGGMHGPMPGLLQGPGVADLHPAAVNLKALAELGHVRLICNTGYRDPVGSHFQSEEMLGERGMDIRSKTAQGWLAYALGQKYPDATDLLALNVTRATLPRYFDGGFIPAGAAAQDLATPSPEIMLALELAASVADDLDSRMKALYLEQHSIMSQLGQIRLEAKNQGARMVEAFSEIPSLQVAYAVSGGFDQHKDFHSRFAAALTEWDACVGAWARGVGLLPAIDGEILIEGEHLLLCTTEFCRSQQMTSAFGLSHGRGGMAILVGKDVVGGITGSFPMIGTPDGEARLLPGSGVKQFLPVEVHHARVGAAVLGWMGLSHEGVWAEEVSPLPGVLPAIVEEEEEEEPTETALGRFLRKVTQAAEDYAAETAP